MLKNDVADKFYKARRTELKDLLDINPALVRPIVTQADAKAGYLNRYFSRPVSDPLHVTEVDKTQYESLKSNPRFVTTKIKWKIIGKQQTQILSSSVNLYGVADMNRIEVANADIAFGGLKNYITDYLEFWFAEKLA